MKMARLVELLEQGGYSSVATYLQSGNVAVTSRTTGSAVAIHLRELIHDEWGFDVPVVMRTHDEIAAVLAADPFGEVADDPARYSVLFFDEKPSREPYVWLPGGTGRSPLMQELGRARFGPASATMRNWRTVEALLDL
jgi:uncharacterized protein (DUF1697 family)